MGLCKLNRNRIAHLKGPLNSYLNKEVDKENPNSKRANPRKLHKVFLLKPLAPFYRRKRSCYVSCAFLSFLIKQSLQHQQLKILLVFLCETTTNQLQQSIGLLWSQLYTEIHANVLVIYWNPCKGKKYLQGQDQLGIGVRIQLQVSTLGQTRFGVRFLVHVIS